MCFLIPSKHTHIIYTTIPKLMFGCEHLTKYACKIILAKEKFQRMSDDGLIIIILYRLKHVAAKKENTKYSNQYKALTE